MVMDNYWLLKFAFQVVGRLPVTVSYALGSVAADVAFIFSRRNKRAVIDNLRRALGTSDEKRLRQASREVFRNLARNYVDMTRFPRLSAENLEHNLNIHGLCHYREAVASGRGVVLATAHLGGFELAGQLWAAKGNRATVLVEPLAHKAKGRLMTQLREGRGLTILPVEQAALRRVVRELRSGGVVVVACDREVAGRGVRVRFLGEEAVLPSAPVDLALLTGAVLIPWFGVREGRRISLFFEPAVPVVGGERDGRQVVENLENLLSVVGLYVRRYPAQWVLTEPVWGPKG